MGVDVHHDGIMLKSATDVANGQVLFRDTFTQYGALTTFIQALALKVFGPYLIVIRLTTVLFYSLSIVLLYYIWRNFISLSFFWILYALFLVLPAFYGWTFHPWSSVYALFFMLLANLFMIEFIKRASVCCLWGVGVSSALAFWCRQPNGIVMFLALFLYFSVCLALNRKSWRTILNNFGICIAAYVICSLIFLVYFGFNDALADWYFQSIRFMFAFGIEGRESTSLFKCLFPGSVFIIFPIVTLSVLCFSLYSLLRHKCDGARQMNQMLLVTAIIGLASWHQYFPVPCLRHFFWAAIPMLGFYAYAIQGIIRFSPEVMHLHLSEHWARFSKLFLVVILVLPFYSTVTRMGKDVTADFISLSRHHFFHDSPLRYMLLRLEEYRFFESLRFAIAHVPHEIANRPGVNFTDAAFFALYFPNQNNFFPMYVNWGNSVYPNYFDKVGCFLSEVGPIVISSKKLEFPGYHLFATIENIKPHIHIYLPDARVRSIEDGGQVLDSVVAPSENSSR
jgi:hypothetical protein